ncbi:hypothetical protein [Nocardiopsis chromatogenes]|uniref:hypothetical protein n=1 Tax=Nocardiopsis chromatogenes TaxID=280239 RepID=UPI00034C3925|nr:hypothetical protein [Nocardiopsis chromatogenes]
MNTAPEPLYFDDLADLVDWAHAVGAAVDLVEKAPDTDTYEVCSERLSAVCRVPVEPDESIRRWLNVAHAGRWHIWRSVDDRGRPAAWVATNLGVSGAAPTLHETTPERLKAAMGDPPRGFAGPLTAIRPTG